MYWAKISALALGLAALVGASGSGLAAPPAAPALNGPKGVVLGTTHVFTWQASPGATWYQIWINDAAATPRLVIWYTAAQAGCGTATGTCSVELSTGFAVGNGRWWVRGWNTDGNGPWSTALEFTIDMPFGVWAKEIPADPRFQLVLGNAAVLDKETGLVWERSPSGQQVGGAWIGAVDYCATKFVGPRGGWRLPAVEELLSLIDRSKSGPALPAGHPFLGLKDGYYWTATEVVYDPAVYAYIVLLTNGTAHQGAKGNEINYAWCVRGGRGDENW